MRILLLAPQPFFEERGTPIAVDLLSRALCERGDQVDLLVFHLGEDRKQANREIHRIKPRPAPGRVPPGLSLAKLWCDVFMFFKAFSMARTRRYDVIHAVEEASFMAMIIGWLLGIPYVVDMDSSMADQIAARFRWAAKGGGVLRWLESLPLRRAVAVVPMCEELAGVARRYCSGPVTVLSDVSLLSGRQSIGDSEDLRETFGIKGPLAMYIGNLEPYQGIDLMLDAFRHAATALPGASLVVIGGAEADIVRYRAKATGLGLEKSVHLIGPRPVVRLDYYMSQADLLVSPRIEGTNTPMKIYSYMDSGRAVLATDLPTHTQALSSREAALAPPTAEEMGEAMRYLLSSPEERVRLATNARDLVQRKYSWDAFRANVHHIFGQLEQGLQAHAGS